MCQPAVVTGFPRDFHSGELATKCLACGASLGARTRLPLSCGSAYSALAEAEVSHQRKILWRFLRKTPKPFEDRCPRMQTPWPGSISEVLMLCCNRCRMSAK